MDKNFKLHSQPSSYNGKNNRKMTLGRLVSNSVQSVPIYKKTVYAGGDIVKKELLGYKYITH